MFFALMITIFTLIAISICSGFIFKKATYIFFIIALITSFAAREVFVGSLATIYSVGNDDEEHTTIKQRMAEEINPETGLKLFNVPVGMSLLVFYAFAMQCVSTLAIVKRETNSWKWPMIQLVGMGVIAYFASLITYTLLS